VFYSEFAHSEVILGFLNVSCHLLNVLKTKLFYSGIVIYVYLKNSSLILIISWSCKRNRVLAAKTLLYCSLLLLNYKLICLQIILKRFYFKKELKIYSSICWLFIAFTSPCFTRAPLLPIPTTKCFEFDEFLSFSFNVSLTYSSSFR